MDGIIDRILNGDGPRPLDIDTAAVMLGTTPGLLAEFERSYHANVLDRKNAPTGPLGPDAKTVVESRSGHGLSDEAFAHEAAHAIRGEVEGPYVMDLYLDDAGQPHVIELNPQSNSGLYALDMDALLTAIRDNPEQFMPDPSRGGMPGCLGVRGGEAI